MIQHLRTFTFLAVAAVIGCGESPTGASLEGNWRGPWQVTPSGPPTTLELNLIGGGRGSYSLSQVNEINAQNPLSGCTLAGTATIDWSTTGSRFTMTLGTVTTVFVGCANPSMNQTITTAGGTSAATYTVTADTLTLIPDASDAGTTDAGTLPNIVLTRVR